VRVFVLDQKLAAAFVPGVPTLAIRIYDSFPPNDGSNPLQPSDNWIKILEYHFDDLEIERYPEAYVKEKLPEWKKKFSLFDEIMAKKLITDFSEYCNVEQVMVHCYAGWSRSPATILGLQKVFNLNIEWAEGRTKRILEARINDGSCGNTSVYSHLIKLKNCNG